MTTRSSKDGERLTDAECRLFHTGHCPDCGRMLIAGPSGGGSQNYMCLDCGSQFNEMGAFGIDRISDASPGGVYVAR